MGYTYPELVNNPSNATLVAHIKSLYAGPANASTSMTKRQEAGPVEKELYLAEVNLPLYGRNGGSPYNVLIFLSDVPSNSKEWLNSESFVGMISTMGGNTQSAKTTTATLDLSHAMERKGVSGNTTEYLKKNLHFRLELVCTQMQNNDDRMLTICRARWRYPGPKYPVLRFPSSVRKSKSRRLMMFLIDGLEVS